MAQFLNINFTQLKCNVSLVHSPSMIPSKAISSPWSTIIPVIGETNLGATGFRDGF